MDNKSPHVLGPGERPSANSRRIELDVDVYADIDFEFFDPGIEKICAGIIPKKSKIEESVVPENTFVNTVLQTADVDEDIDVQFVDPGNKDIHAGIIPKKTIEECVDPGNTFVNTILQTVESEATVKQENVEHLLSSQLNREISKANNLMNCIAYSSQDDTATKSFGFDSLSSNTTSEITNVTSRTTSSEYSMLRSESKSSPRKQRPLRQNHQTDSAIKLLVDTLSNLEIGDHECDSKTISGSTSFTTTTSSTAGTYTSRRNMSFTKHQLREIDRENAILLRKINSNKNSRRRPSIAPPNFNLTSAAINRRNLQLRIEAENRRIVKKLEAVKATTDTSSPWVFSRRK